MENMDIYLFIKDSDCTGGHKVMQFDTASRNKLKYIRKGGHYGQRNKQYIRVESLHGD